MPRGVKSICGWVKTNITFGMEWITYKDAGDRLRLKFIFIVWSE
jgi:hypothetical protein